MTLWTCMMRSSHLGQENQRAAVGECPDRAFCSVREREANATADDGVLRIGRRNAEMGLADRWDEERSKMDRRGGVGRRVGDHYVSDLGANCSDQDWVADYDRDVVGVASRHAKPAF